MTQVQATRSSESPWVTGAFLALSFIVMTLVLSLPLVVRSLYGRQWVKGFVANGSA